MTRPVIRELMLQRGRRPVSTGLWFALGHASVVVALALSIALVLRDLVRLLRSARAGTVDSADGVLMTRAYTWALVRPLRRLWVNVLTTALTVSLALLVAVVVTAGLLAEAGLDVLEPLATVGEHFQTLGWAMLLVLLAVWAGGALWWRGKAGEAT